MAPLRPSQEEHEWRKTVGINLETVTNVTSTDYPNHYPGEDNSWDINQFRQGLQVQFHQNNQFEASFSLIGIDASLANAFRRIMISEIPTLAIEKVFINDNSSVIQDEVLAHRLGLIPFKGNKEGLVSFLKWYKDSPYDFNTVMLTLKVECTHNLDAQADEDEDDPRKLYYNAHIYARDLVFHPIGRQEEYFCGDGVIAPVNPDILIAKLRPGQNIDATMHMHKGIGADHAKFSPVAPASYRLLPTITLKEPIFGLDAEKFRRCFPKGVIGLKKVSKAEAKAGGPYEGREGEIKAVVKNVMLDTVSRECLRHDEFKDKVQLGRKRDHFIFSVQSTGQWDSDELFLESIKLLKEKAKRFEKMITEMGR